MTYVAEQTEVLKVLSSELYPAEVGGWFKHQCRFNRQGFSKEHTLKISSLIAISQHSDNRQSR